MLWKIRWHDGYDRMFSWTRGTHNKLFDEAVVCSLCGDPFSQFKDSLSKDTDHCHKKKVFRGIIHHGCNVAIGYLEDDPEKCIKAARYLRIGENLIPLWIAAIDLPEESVQ